MRFNPWRLLFVGMIFVMVTLIVTYLLYGSKFPLLTGYIIGIITLKLKSVSALASEWSESRTVLSFGSDYERMKHDYDVRHVSTWSFVRREPARPGQDSHKVFSCSRHGEWPDKVDDRGGCPMCLDLGLKGRFTPSAKLTRSGHPVNISVHCDTHKSFDYDCLDCSDALIEHRHGRRAQIQEATRANDRAHANFYGEPLPKHPSAFIDFETHSDMPFDRAGREARSTTILDPEEREALLRRNQGSYPPGDIQ